MLYVWTEEHSQGLGLSPDEALADGERGHWAVAGRTLGPWGSMRTNVVSSLTAALLSILSDHILTFHLTK